jgi:ribose transport system permease protein
MSVTSVSAPPSWNAIIKRFGVVGVIPVLLILILAGMTIIEPRFYNGLNLFNILRNTSFLAIIASGQMMVMIVGGMDLSVGATAALASVVAAKVMFNTAGSLGETEAILCGAFASLLCGAVIGLFNGLCSTLLRVPSLIVTLGTLSVVSGITLILTSGIPVYGMPQSFIKEFGRAFWWGVPALAYVAAAVVLVVFILQRRTVLGTHIYAVGGNLTAATVSGIPARTYVVLSFVGCAMLASVTGLLITAQMGSGQTNLGGDRLVLLSIAAAVIGGTSLRGGVGRIEMVAFSALFLSTLTNALNLLRIDSKKELVVLGFLMLAAIAADTATRRGKDSIE